MATSRTDRTTCNSSAINNSRRSGDSITTTEVKTQTKRERKREEQRRWRAKLSSERKEAEKEKGKLRRRKHRLHMSDDKVQEIKLKDRMYQHKRRLCKTTEKEYNEQYGSEDISNKKSRIEFPEDDSSGDGNVPWYY